MPTYTIKWTDAGGADHTFAGMGDTSLAAFVSALVIHPDITLMSVTLNDRIRADRETETPPPFRGNSEWRDGK